MPSFFEPAELSYRFFLTKEDLDRSMVITRKPLNGKQYIEVQTVYHRKRAIDGIPVFATCKGKLTCISDKVPYTFMLEHKGYLSKDYWIYTNIETSMGHIKDWKLGQTRNVSSGDMIGYAGYVSPGGGAVGFLLQCILRPDKCPTLCVGYLDPVVTLKQWNAVYPTETRLHPFEIAALALGSLVVGAVTVYVAERSARKM